MYDKVFDCLRFIASTAVGIFTFIYGNIDNIFYALVALIIVDYLSGVVSAIIEKKLSSAVGFVGILKKVVILCVVAVGSMCDKLTGSGDTFRNMVCAFYIANEALSIIENAGRIGLPIPKKILDVIETIKNGGDENGSNNHI